MNKTKTLLSKLKLTDEERMKFDEEGRLRAINPEYGFFGVAPGMNTIDTLVESEVFSYKMVRFT